MPGHWLGWPRKMTSIQKASDHRRWLTKPVMLMAGEPGSVYVLADISDSGGSDD